jgi:hypothetical protein
MCDKDSVTELAYLRAVKLIIPLADQVGFMSDWHACSRFNLQYDYYHGGIASFLRLRELPESDHSPFYNLSSPLFTDFTAYLHVPFCCSVSDR